MVDSYPIEACDSHIKGIPDKSRPTLVVIVHIVAMAFMLYLHYNSQTSDSTLEFVSLMANISIIVTCTIFLIVYISIRYKNCKDILLGKINNQRTKDGLWWAKFNRQLEATILFIGIALMLISYTLIKDDLLRLSLAGFGWSLSISIAGTWYVIKAFDIDYPFRKD